MYLSESKSTDCAKDAIGLTPAFPPPSDVWLGYVVDVLGRAGSLTPAERGVLEPLLLGRGYAEIATILGKSPHTVAVQVKAILRRLQASSSRDLLRVFLCELDRSPVPAVPV